MDTLTEIADSLGRAEICRRLNVGPSALSNHIAAGQFPSSWYDVLTTLAFERELHIPRDKFNWRKADVSEVEK